MSDPCDIGLVGLGVMGANLALNMAEKGHRVALFDRDPARAAALAGGEFASRFVACTDAAALLSAIRPPRPVILLVPAGEATDAAIANLKQHLAAGDILIDGGNANFQDTRRRTAEMEGQGFAFLGLGVSGGAEGARHGPAIMAGGSRHIWERVAPVLTSIAAQHHGAPCADWLGPDGAGHFVKTIHNGIEYADMQMIAEVYGLLRDGRGMASPAIGAVFQDWSAGPLQSYLIESVASVARAADPDTGAPMLDIIVDRAGQKGTGRWSVVEAAHLGAVVSTIEAAVGARNISADPARGEGASQANAVDLSQSDLHDALLFGKLIAYAQGFQALARASESYDWSLDLARVARVWRAGCIIRSTLLDPLAEALSAAPDGNLLSSPMFAGHLPGLLPGLRRTCGAAVAAGLPVPALLGALSYHDQMVQSRGTANMLQGLRDFFGQHGFERTDRPGSGHHGPWGGNAG